MTINQTVQNNAFKNVLYKGNLKDLQTMLEQGAMADFPDPDPKSHHNTPIHLAAYNKWPDKLKALLASLQGDRLENALKATNINGATPLFEAIWVGRPPCVFKYESNDGVAYTFVNGSLISDYRNSTSRALCQ